MKGILQEDVKVLIPNAEHKNFTEGSEVITKGTEVEGNITNVQGLRRGQPFTYRLFTTNKNQIIYLKPIKMENTEVTLGLDAQPSARKVDFIPAEMYSKLKLIGLGAGGFAGYYYGHKKGAAGKKLAMYIGIGAIAGYVTAMVIDNHKKATITKVPAKK